MHRILCRRAMNHGCPFLTARLPSSPAVPRHNAHPGTASLGSVSTATRFVSDAIAIRRCPESEHKQEINGEYGQS
jgi:hypothetical protein